MFIEQSISINEEWWNVSWQMSGALQLIIYSYSGYPFLQTITEQFNCAALQLSTPWKVHARNATIACTACTLCDKIVQHTPTLSRLFCLLVLPDTIMCFTLTIVYVVTRILADANIGRFARFDNVLFYYLRSDMFIWKTSCKETQLF